MGFFARISGLVQDLNANMFNLLNVKNYASKAEIAVTASGSSMAIDFSAGCNIALTLNVSTTLTFTAPPSVSSVYIRCIQGSGGSHTITWPAVKWANSTAPTLSTSVGAEDFVVFRYNGTSYYGEFAPNFG